MPVFNNHAEQEAFYAWLSQGKGIAYLEQRLAELSDAEQSNMLDQLRAMRNDDGRGPIR